MNCDLNVTCFVSPCYKTNICLRGAQPVQTHVQTSALRLLAVVMFLKAYRTKMNEIQLSFSKLSQKYFSFLCMARIEHSIPNNLERNDTGKHSKPRYFPAFSRTSSRQNCLYFNLTKRICKIFRGKVNGEQIWKMTSKPVQFERCHFLFACFAIVDHLESG